MNSVEQCNVQHVIGGIEAVEGFLSTTVELTKQVKPNFALPPYLGVTWPLNGIKTEGRQESLCIMFCIGRCHKCI